MDVSRVEGAQSDSVTQPPSPSGNLELLRMFDELATAQVSTPVTAQQAQTNHPQVTYENSI